eukprot:CAMPEP_0185158650 /NCGR_PEP_ID=MMETSP1139-20130426/2546_1 /TAXON_ID=298111 /ORGANISM="Pavlova sp., Strain CCMP459" /LENGTH=100 /DNA_ID=CAMNT_0027723795 /DNA_START=143 /DNA_END=442 /DNA_ORIENTATION=+
MSVLARFHDVVSPVVRPVALSEGQFVAAIRRVQCGVRGDSEAAESCRPGGEADRYLSAGAPAGARLRRRGARGAQVGAAGAPDAQVRSQPWTSSPSSSPR